MDAKMPLVVPATVPDANARRIRRAEADAPIVLSADPAPVPVARAIPIVPVQPTADDVDQLRQENAALRAQLGRVPQA
jgi:hypothetical protein